MSIIQFYKSNHFKNTSITSVINDYMKQNKMSYSKELYNSLFIELKSVFVCEHTTINNKNLIQNRFTANGKNKRSY